MSLGNVITTTGNVAAILVLVALGVGGAVWIGQSGTGEEVQAREESGVPEGPQPKAATDETTHDFGAMKHGATGKHTFVIRNEGDAPLIVKKGETTCSCTLSEIAEGAIEPGDEVEVKLEWKPKGEEPFFRQRATIITNDPFRGEIVFSIEGRVEETLKWLPATVWDVGRVDGDEPVEVKGVVYSSVLEEFQVVEVEHEPLITHEVQPLDEQELAEFDAKSGFRILATLDPKGLIGSISHPIVVKTDVEDGLEQRITLKARISGPVKMLPRGRNFDFHQFDNGIDLRTFEAKDGTTARLAIIAKDPSPEEPFEVTGIRVEPDYLVVKTKRDPAFRAKGKTLQEMTVEFPAGATPDTRVFKEAGKIFLTTNHPDAKEIKFFVIFVAR